MAKANSSFRFKAMDLISRIVPSTFFLLIVLRNAADLYLLVTEPSDAALQPSMWRWLSIILARLATIAFLGLMSVLFIIRIAPIRKASGLLPRVMAVLGTFCLYALTLFPRTQLSTPLIATASVIGLAGTFLSVYTLAYLGRSFSLMAEARRLVTSGPYRLIRHPLYLFETLASLSVLIQFFSFYTLLIFIAYLIIQMQRMKNEEAVLQKVFPEYETYQLETYRVVPGLY